MPMDEEEILKRLSLVEEENDLADLSDSRIVTSAGGSQVRVLNEMEETWFNKTLQEYQDQYLFENVADLTDLDRLMVLELLSMRYGFWLSSGVDYNNAEFVEKTVSERKDKLDTQIRMLKKHMGMDRKGRVESESESMAEYLKNLLRRAEEFGVHRDNQVAKAIDLFMELKKLIGIHERTDEEERRHLGVDLDSIYVWIRDVAIPEFDEIDDAFRKNQRIWIREVNS